MENIINENNWQTLTQFFPYGWKDKAKELGVLERKRKFKNESDLLHVLLIHLANNCSLKETVIRAKLGSIVSISDVALLKKLKLSSEWFRWMSLELLQQRGIYLIPPEKFHDYHIRTIDATVISEPGSTGTDWRCHYSMELFSLKCDEFILSRKNQGESFINFKVNKKDLLIGDRAYGRYKSMKYVLNNGADFVIRYMNKAFTIYDKNCKKINLLSALKNLKEGQIFERKVLIGVGKEEKIGIRICAIKKSTLAAEQSVKRVLKEISKKQRTINQETLDLHRYVIIMTSLPDTISAKEVLQLYRLRWQIELSFKKLKSIFGLGYLPKKDEKSARAWLHGKLFVSFLVQTMIDYFNHFSPWGYRIQ